MPATVAQLRANQANARKSTGPKTPEGKAICPANSFKHGLTGAGVVLPNEDVAEVELRFQSFLDEMQPSSAAGVVLVRRAAFLSVRLDRCVSHDTASLRDRIRRAEADLVIPDGVDAETAGQIRAEARAMAMFDPSPEATLARRYEAATERGFLKALKEFRSVERQATTTESESDSTSFNEALASLIHLKQKVATFEARYPEPADIEPILPPRRRESASLPPTSRQVDVPITIGRRP